MGLVDEAVALSKQRGPKCTVGTFLASVDDELRDEITEAIEDPAVETSALVRALEARGYEVPNRGRWGYHYNHDCACWR